MMESSESNSIVRNPELVVASVYERVIEASIERVWENVYDWEHLPHLHSEAFTSIALLDSGLWGWRATVGMAGGQDGKIELIADKEAHHYVARTLEGPGATNETWTALDPISKDRTGIRVEFCIPPMEEKSLRQFGQAMIGLYTLLWNQDEEMMQTRTHALADRETRGSVQDVGSVLTLSLGSVEEFQSRLPFVIEMDQRSYRVIESNGEFIAHSTQCPHLLGPLTSCPVQGGEVICPWHGYAFDVHSGKSTDGHALRLRPAPRIQVDETTGRVVASLNREEQDRSESE